MTGETENRIIPIDYVIDTEKRNEALLEMLAKQDKEFPIRVLLVGSGGDFNYSNEIAGLLAHKNFDVQIISAREAKEFTSLKPNNDLIEVPYVIPKLLQYYPHSSVEPNRRERRKQERKNKRKKRK
jgi:hypothetical protein